MPIRLSGLSSGLDTEAIIGDLMKANKMKLTKIENKQTKLTWTQEKWKELNKKIYSLYTDKLSKLRLQSTYMTKTVKSSNEGKATVTGNPNAAEGTQSLEIKQLASSQYTTGAKLGTDMYGAEITTGTRMIDLGYSVGDTITIANGVDENGNPRTQTFTVDGENTLNDFLKSAKEAGLNASFDNSQKRLFLSSKVSGQENSFTITANSLSSATGENGLEALGLGNGAVTKAAEDAIYRLNGMEFTSSGNTVNVNGLTIQLSGTTAGYDSVNPADRESISLTVNTDVDKVYNTIKDFVTSYNELLKEMNDLFYAGSARGYEPLTSEEKEAMSEDEIEKWETKIKDSLLRRDDSLGGLINGMKAALGGSVTIDGKNYSLSTFGISTSSDYTEKGLLHIYGDADDSTYSGKADKLKAALTNDPENTMQALSKIFDGLYSEMTDRMKATKLSSALTFYNDKELTKLEQQYKKEYSTMEERLKKIEDQYYKQFGAMETAMAKLNSQQSYLAGLFGTGQ